MVLHNGLHAIVKNLHCPSNTLIYIILTWLYNERIKSYKLYFNLGAETLKFPKNTINIINFH